MAYRARLAGVHHFVPNRTRRSAHFPTKELVLHDSRRSAQHQKLSVSEVADAAGFQGAAETFVDGDSAAKQLDGAVEYALISHASLSSGGGHGGGGICESQVFHGVVLK